MPYSPNDLPERIKGLPAHAQDIWISAFNSAFENTPEGQDQEEYANKVAWSAIEKAGYSKNPQGDWIKTSEDMSMHKLQAMHNKLHGEYVDARFTRKLKSEIETQHAELVKKIKDMGGRHNMNDKLDKTLPEDMMMNEFRYLGELSEIKLSENDQLPTSEIQIMRTGKFTHNEYGKFNISKDDIKQMKSNFDTGVRPKAPTQIVVDYEHTSAGGSPTPEAPAAGWVKELVDKGVNGLWAVVEWTKKAAEMIKNKEYRFISPEFTFDYQDKESGKNVGACLLAVALTNRPFLEGMQPVMLSENISKNIVSAIPMNEMENATNQEVKGVSMEDEKKEELKEEAKEIQEEIKEESKTEEETVELTEEPKVENNQPAEEVKEEIKEETKEEEVESKLEESVELKENSEVLKFKEENERLKLVLRERDIKDEVKKLTEDGKVLPKQSDSIVNFLMSLSDDQANQFKSILTDSPSVIQFSEEGSGSDETPDEDNRVELDKEARKLSEEKGVDYKTAVREVLKSNPELGK